MDDQKCKVCDEPLRFAWTDTHGIGACATCGLPYRIFYYEKVDGKERRVERPPECAIREESMPIAHQYWKETRRRVFPGIFDMGILSGRGRTYSGATQEEMVAFCAWYDDHPELHPAPVDEVGAVMAQ